MTTTAAAPAPWRGIFAIPVTSFRPDGTVDDEGLRRQVEFCLAGGATGVVYPGVVSEFFALDDDERRRATEVVVAAVAGRVPVVVGATAGSAGAAARLSAHAASIGADGVMATLPPVQHLFTPDQDFVIGYFRTLATGSDLPIVLQNARIGHPIPLGRLREVVEAVPQVRYLKEETSPSTHQLTRAVDAVGDLLDGVFAGLGGVFLMSELDRGAAGSMPAPPYVDRLSAAHDLHAAGERVAAREVLAPLAPLFTFEMLYNVAVIKEVLVRRGVIEHTTCRTPAPHLDKTDLRELDELLEVAQLPTYSG
ncbi:dihydrodipicolinate synthase family protein [Angustibacter speluncae]